ncbi:hypothetical protein BABINDRAFT_8352 [Babjeviella inositovora NRRL Y-12698]|uniref:Uncharacterized protein n=1 Tax=Babjeviella inositovora NRRL Y-12698 TaxID=984486 RepID=A0A1E3QNZ6_9ASCO|nr:uncharacterized protein BABINDRAFT_8352 [Babjeviella inositovora NRRL Y-12698]ODQ79413.1 hypothetical protein BABINDRAFT_8352 [Babjeviella inositovora NRRL Y-12698]
MENYSEINLLQDTLRDETSNFFVTELRLISTFAEYNEMYVRLIQPLNLSDLSGFAPTVDASLASQEAMLAEFNTYFNQLTNAGLIMAKVRYRFKTLPDLVELKDILTQINDHICVILTKCHVWVSKFTTQFINKNLITHRSVLKSLNIDALLGHFQTAFNNFKAIAKVLSYCPSSVEDLSSAEALKNFYRILSEFNNRVYDENEQFLAVVRAQTPAYAAFEVVKRTKRQQLSYEEYQQEMRIIARGDYKEDSKKASKKLVNKNLMVMLHISLEIQPFMERINDQVLWVLKNYYLSIMKMRHENNLSSQLDGLEPGTEDEGKTNVDLNEFMAQIRLLIDEINKLNLIMIQLFYDDFLNNSKDYLKKGRFLLNLLITSQPICDSIIQINFIYNKLMKHYNQQLNTTSAIFQNQSLNLTFRNVFVYSIFDQQFSNFNNILKKMLEVIKANQDPTKSVDSLDKLLKNEYAINELYGLGKELSRLGSCIDVNQLNNKKVVIDEVL